ncbi:MAG: cell division protein FtsZ [Candidatus Arcticimaribacter sp.]|nr:cell division protein FtsZ [Flavobacteriaceae bacterium]PSR10840.1 MAG: cell division protein FtsZ [Candidatus Arcticimaribacter sp.]PTM01742.1 MAG: cell division protein FtsZ [Candidatus Arcticimaribacter sp.]
MDTFTTGINFDLPKNKSNVIKVIGVGGGGSNAINYMFQQGIMGVDFVVCNTDAQALEKSAVPIKIQLGASLTEGLGAGANPDVGRQSAQESYDDLHTLLSTQTKMVFITAGMGGGTGTGAAPIIARMAKDLDVLTVGIVTMPFQFEGKIRLEQAQKGMEELKNNVDSLIVINNNKLREVYGNLGFKAGFSKADEVLATAARGIAEVITHHYTQNIDLKDAKTVLTNSGSAIMGSASASGANRAQESIVKALDSPLLNDNKITGCKNVLLLIVSGEEEITIDEIGEINDFIQSEAGNNTNIIMGVGDDPELGDSISVTIIATGFNSDQQHEIVNTEAKKVIHTLEEDQPFVHDLTEKKEATSAFSAPIITSEVKEPVVKFTLEDDLVEEVAETSMEQALVQKNIPDDAQILLTEDLLDLDVVFEQVGVEEPVAEIEVEPEFISPSFVLEEKSEIEEEFVINEVVNVRDIEVIDAEHLTPELEEENQISFEFDLPLAKAEVSAVQPIHFEEPVVISEIQVPVKETVVEEVPTVFQLEETVPLEELVSPVSEGKLNDIDVEYKVVTKESTPEETTKVRDSNPFDRSIDESVNSENEKRKEQLKKFNYTFKNNINRIEEMEKQPAYKRMGFDIDAAPEASGNSQMTLDTDSNEDIQFRSNNSFLHDNVD